MAGASETHAPTLIGSEKAVNDCFSDACAGDVEGGLAVDVLSSVHFSFFSPLLLSPFARVLGAKLALGDIGEWSLFADDLSRRDMRSQERRWLVVAITPPHLVNCSNHQDLL